MKDDFEGSEDDDEAGHVMGSISCRYFFCLFSFMFKLMLYLYSFHLCVLSPPLIRVFGVGGNWLLFLFLLYISLSASEEYGVLIHKIHYKEKTGASSEKSIIINIHERECVNQKRYSSKRKNKRRINAGHFNA